MTHQVDEHIRRDTPRRGPAVVMALGIIGALVLAVMFPFALATVQPKPLTPLERAIQQLNHENLLIGGDAGSELDTSTLRLLEVDENGVEFFAGFSTAGGPAGVILGNGDGDGSTVGTAEVGSEELAFGTGGNGAAYLSIVVAPTAELGFRYCALSTTDETNVEMWIDEAASACGGPE